jgi:rhodanese-related sulfurtransferase
MGRVEAIQEPVMKFIATMVLMLVGVTSAAWAAKPAASVPADKLIQPAALAALLRQAAPQPVLLHVGFRTMFDQAHIPGSVYVGPGSAPAGLKALRDHVASLPRDAAIVIYCGCCPWDRCPNVAAAYDALTALGYTRVQVMYIADDFGRDWVEKGYPVTQGD